MPPLGLILLLLLVALPLLEIAILIKVGSILGVWPVLAIIVATFLTGIYVVRHQGVGVARRMMASARSGEPPVEPMVEGMLLFIAGGCLIAPGLITDAIGLLLLIPPLRQWAARWMLTRGLPMSVYRVRRTSRTQGPRDTSPPNRRQGPAPVIEGDYERLDERPATKPDEPPRAPPQS
jgi:UPF0716 protein FxsA